jgi:rhodanese-related sulfurtransferase
MAAGLLPALVYSRVFAAGQESGWFTGVDDSTMERYLEFAGNHPILLGGLVFTLFLLIFTELRRKTTGVTSIEPQDAVQLINKDAVVIDLRSAEAFARGHIVNARNIPYDELSAKGDVIDKYKSKPIVAVCDAGQTSGRAVTQLRKSGFENIYGLRGGISAWQQASLPLVTAHSTGRKTGKKKS